MPAQSCWELKQVTSIFSAGRGSGFWVPGQSPGGDKARRPVLGDAGTKSARAIHPEQASCVRKCTA